MSDKEDSGGTLSDIYHALRAKRRRFVIQILAQSEDDELSVRELARRIASMEENIEPEKATGKPYRNVYNALSQGHLSTLSNARLIIYDPDRQTVKPGPEFQLGILLVVLNRVTYQTLRKEDLTDDDLEM